MNTVGRAGLANLETQNEAAAPHTEETESSQRGCMEATSLRRCGGLVGWDFPFTWRVEGSQWMMLPELECCVNGACVCVCVWMVPGSD